MRATLFPAAAAAAALILAGCGDDDAGAPPTDEADLVVHGDDGLRWDQERYEASAGEISVVLVNDGNLPHTLLVEDADGNQVEGFKLSVGRRDQGTVELDPGQYVLWCDVPGHRSAGMVADLVVE